MTYNRNRAKITREADPAADQGLDHPRVLFANTLRQWQITQQQILPHLGPPPQIDEEKPELTPLRLPSSFTASQREEFRLTDAAEVELRLRRGDAFDALSDLRDTIHELNHTTTEKRVEPSGQKTGTRAQAQIAAIKSRMEDSMQRYMTSFIALTSLGCPTQDEGLYPLDKNQLWGKNVFIPHVTGDSTRENPWFWSVGKPAGLSERSWLIERKLIYLQFQILLTTIH